MKATAKAAAEIATATHGLRVLIAFSAQNREVTTKKMYKLSLKNTLE